MKLAEVNEMLNFYVRPQTFPFAVRFCQSLDELPPRARLPKKTLGMQVPVCQAVGMVRRYGWTLALTPDDVACPYGALALGFAKPREDYLNGSYSESISPGSGSTVSRSAQSMPMLEFGKYAAVVFSPLQSAVLEPHLIVVYGNSAQVMRMVQGTLHSRGGALQSHASGNWDCGDLFARPMETSDAHVVLPCNGDRIFGLTQDDEMAFTIPASLIEETLAGLKASHDSGAQRYPIPSFLRFEAKLPPSYYTLMDYLKSGE